MQLTELSVARTVAAAPATLFNLWLDPTQPGSPWYGAAGLVIHATVGGLFYFAVQHENHVWAHYGRFLRIDPPTAISMESAANGAGLIEYTWLSEATHGVETVVTLTFQPLSSETEVTLRHSKVPDDEMGRRHAEGWTWMLNTLADRFGIDHATLELECHPCADDDAPPADHAHGHDPDHDPAVAPSAKPTSG